MKKIIFLGLFITICFASCKKDSNNVTNQNQTINTWTFTASDTVYKGELLWDPLLNTLLQSNNSYTFSMLGGEANSDRTFNIVMSLTDTTFTASHYESGVVSGDGYITSFYFGQGIVGDDIYKSTNTYPGPVMNYTIESYNASTKTLVIVFSGNAQDALGNLIPITNGKVTCKVEKM